MSEEEKEEITEEVSQEEEENEDSKNSPGENSENLFIEEEDANIPAVEEPGPEEDPEPEEVYGPVYVNMTLKDGTKLENLLVNGTNFISSAEISKDIFTEDNMSSIMIEVNDETMIFENMALTQLIQFKGQWWFCIHEMSKIEQIEHDIEEMKLTEEKLAEDIEKIAMSNPDTIA